MMTLNGLMIGILSVAQELGFSIKDKWLLLSNQAPLLVLPTCMSSVPNGADISAGTHPDLSLGSFVSGPSTPGRPLRVPSISSPAPSNGDGPDTPLPRARRPRQSAPGGKGAALSLRDQEKVNQIPPLTGSV